MANETYPECERMSAVRDESQSIGAFVEWLGEQNWEIIDSIESEHHGFPVHIRLSTEELLAKYFDIDLVLVEKERRAMLANLNTKDTA